MDSNINIRLKHTIHGTPTSKCWTMCNPWNLKLKLSDNMQSMELQPVRQCACNPWNFSCNMTICLQYVPNQHSTHLQTINPDTSLSLPQAPSPTPPNDDKCNDAKHNQLAIKKS